MNRLNHSIESLINSNFENVSVMDMNKLIVDYDTIYETIEYPYVSHIKKRIVKKYSGIKTLPNSLAIDEILLNSKKNSIIELPSPKNPTLSIVTV